jgi:hypothetical protein
MGDWPLSVRDSLNHTGPFVHFCGLRDQLKILDIPPNRPTASPAEDQTQERPPLSLPILCEGLEADVHREQDAPEGTCAIKELIAGKSVRAIFHGSYHVYPSPA